MKPVHLKGSEKICKVCQQVKPMIDFPKRGNHRLNSCQPCYNEYYNLRERTRYRDDPDYRKKKLSNNKALLKHRYNTTPDEVQETLIKQNYKCANSECNTIISLSETSDFEKKAVIDHNHKNGKFRSLLCQRCNLILGYLETRPETIKGLYDYIKLHSL